MFENIIGQPGVVERLATETRSAIVPPTLLFHGPDYSGKSSTALELARVLTCAGGDRDVPWRCTCRSCVQQRHLMQPDTLLLGGRYFNREIAVAASALKRDHRVALRYLLERSVRKLTRRFDPVLWEGEETRLKKIDPLLSQLDEALAPFLPDAELPDDRRFVKELDSVVAICEKIVSAQPLDAVPVHLVRRLSSWAHVAPSGPAKVALIENIDRLGESARNALLKTLEEPPPGVYFILTTQRRGAVMATILSRARAYGFSTRGEEQSAAVIERIFRDTPPASPSIRDYFVGLDGRGLRPLAERFLERCLAGDDLELGLLDEIDEVIRSQGPAEGFRYFVEELGDLMQAILRSRLGNDGSGRGGGPPVSPRVLSAWRAELRRAANRVEAYNVAPVRALEGLYYDMRRAA
jgi:DNA polymerase III delta prime subunit